MAEESKEAQSPAPASGSGEASSSSPNPGPASASVPAPVSSGGSGPRGGGGGGMGSASFGGGRDRGSDRGPNRGGNRGPRRRDDFDKEKSDLTEKVVFINRSSKVVKGGRRFSFSALIVIGDKAGKVGIGLGKASEVADAIRKGGEDARQHMLPVSLVNTTIPHEVTSEFGGARVMLKPASPGTGIIAGKTVRDVIESVGIKDILTKSLGSKNAANVAKATLKALRELRLREEIYKARGLSIRPAARAQTATANS